MQYDNAKQKPRVTPETSGAVYVDRQSIDLSGAPAYLNGDVIQVGVVPAGSKLIPHLTRLSFPVLDSNATPTGTYNVGTLVTPTALATGLTAGTAVTRNVGSLPDVAIGDPDVEVPIYLTLTAALATQAAAGKVQLDLAVRAWDHAVD